MATKKATRKPRKRGVKLIDRAKRIAIVTRLHKAGKSKAQIARALGWPEGNGYGMVKRLMIKARLRRK